MIAHGGHRAYIPRGMGASSGGPASPAAPSIARWQLALAAGAGLVYFMAVLTGAIEATGAPPGGVLSGTWAKLASVAMHALAGGLTTWLIAFGWSAQLALLITVVGLVRGRGRWVGLAIWIGVLIGTKLAITAIPLVMDWLGSASPGTWDGARTWFPPFWDAAAYWGASAFTGVLLFVTLPTYLKGVWAWSHRRPFGRGPVWFTALAYSSGIAAFLLPWAVSWALLIAVVSAFRH